MIELLGSPIHSHSLASTHLMAERVKEHGINVLYGGEGADELSVGYNTYSNLYEQSDHSKISTIYSSCVNKLPSKLLLFQITTKN